MSRLHEQKCPRCGAPVRFDPERGKLVCDYCDYILEITPELELNGFDFQKLTDAVSSQMNLSVYVCVSCGAEVIATPQQMALTCPYCQNNIVLTDKASGTLRPDGVIPFRILSKDLPVAVSRYYKDKKLLPREFFSQSTMGSVTGVYAPFWVFSGNVSGELQYKGELVSSTRKGDYLYTKTDHYLLSRSGSVDFDHLPVDAGERIDNALMDSLEPFDLRDAKPFDMGYLAGFTAERFDETKSTLSERARDRMLNTAKDVITPTAGKGYTNVSYAGGSLNASLDAKYLLFPVYLFDISFEKKKYQCG